jgi:hypothetical protein
MSINRVLANISIPDTQEVENSAIFDFGIFFNMLCNDNEKVIPSV